MSGILHLVAKEGAFLHFQSIFGLREGSEYFVYAVDLSLNVVRVVNYVINIYETGFALAFCQEHV